MVRALGIAGLLLAASVVAGCGNSGTDPGGGPTQPLPQIGFVTTDLSTGTRVATVQIYGGLDDVLADLLSAVASKIRVATWPDDVEVRRPRSSRASHTQSCRTARSKPRLPRSKSCWIRLWTRTPGTRSRWRRSRATYSLPSEANAFAFNGGARGARFSPAHAPVVASVMSCAKDGRRGGGVRAVQRAGGQGRGRDAATRLRHPAGRLHGRRRFDRRDAIHLLERRIGGPTSLARDPGWRHRAGVGCGHGTGHGSTRRRCRRRRRTTAAPSTSR